MVAVRLSRLHAAAAAPRVRLQRLHVQASPVDPDPGNGDAQVRLVRLHAHAGPILTTLEARAGADQSVQGFSTVTLDGRSSIAATILTWEQVSGATVDLAGATMGVRTFTAPPVAAGASLVFRLVASDGSTNVMDTVVITVQPWQEWRHNGTTWVPQQTYFLGVDNAQVADVFFDNGAYYDTGLRLRT